MGVWQQPKAFGDEAIPLVLLALAQQPLAAAVDGIATVKWWWSLAVFKNFSSLNAVVVCPWPLPLRWLLLLMALPK